jgi:hypothetical protein
MKKKITILILCTIFSHFQGNAQFIESDFENLLLPSPPLGAFWDGSDQSGGFVSGGMYFPNVFDTAFGGYWASGFAYSSVIDSVTSGFTNLFAAKPASGFNGSDNYAVVQQNAVARLNNVVPTMVIHGFYVTNGTYAYNSMRDGDIFARKFGDTTGTNSGLPQGSYPDFFKLTVKSYVGGQLGNDSVEFYLADFRFSNDSLDYIVNTWEWVDCSIFQVFDSLKFTLSSSDNGVLGMNTPAFFCIDNLGIDVTVGKNETALNQDRVEIYPNPANQTLYLKNSQAANTCLISIFNMHGQLLLEKRIETYETLDISNLSDGFYSVKIQTDKGIFCEKFTKK